MPKKVEKRSTGKVTKKPVTKDTAEPKKPKKRVAVTRKSSAKSKKSDKSWSKELIKDFYGFISKSVEELYGVSTPAKLRDLATVGKSIKDKVYEDAVAKDLRATESKYMPAVDAMRIVATSITQAADLLKMLDLDKAYERGTDTMTKMLAHFATGIDDLDTLSKSCTATSRSAYKKMCDKRTHLQKELAEYKKAVAGVGEEEAARMYITKSAESMKKEAAEMLEKVKEAEQKCKELEAAAQLLERIEAELNKD